MTKAGIRDLTSPRAGLLSGRSHMPAIGWGKSPRKHGWAALQAVKFSITGLGDRGVL